MNRRDVLGNLGGALALGSLAVEGIGCSQGRGAAFPLTPGETDLEVLLPRLDLQMATLAKQPLRSVELIRGARPKAEADKVERRTGARPARSS